MVQIQRVKRRLLFTPCILLVLTVAASAQPTFTSLHVFGDGTSSTTDGPTSPYYYNNRRSNGRMWVEVIAQWRRLDFDVAGNTLSFWEHYSPILVENVDAYVAPADVSTALFVVWVANADMYKNISTSPGLVYDDTVLSVWTNNNNAWISNHYKVITNLYAKGVRTLVMPDAGDLTKTPNFAPGLTEDERDWIRERIIAFNADFRAKLDEVRSTLTDLTIYAPDMFSLFDAVLADPAAYGMVNPGVGALNDPYLGDYSLDGPGADYVFWDHIHPTAKLQMLVAETVQELIWPIAVESISSDNGTNRLDVVNVPIGRDGLVLAASDLVSLTNVVLAFESTNTSQTFRVPASGPSRFYRLQFPFHWVWP